MPAPPVTAYSPAELWYFNGSPLQTSYMSITTFGGSRFGLPTLRGTNIEAPYRAGQAWRAKYPDSRTITLNMFVDGNSSSSAGYPAADPRLAFNNNIQQLRQLFWQQSAAGSVQSTLQRQWYLTQGSNKLVTATALAEVAGSMDLTMNGRTNAAFSIDLLLSDPYFYGSTQTQTVTGSGTIVNLGEGVAGQGYPGAVSTFTVTIPGSVTVTNSTAGCSFTYTAQGGENWPVTVDVLADIAYDSSLVNYVAGMTHVGSRLWMALMPGSNTITASGGQAVTFQWTPPYV